MKLMQAETDGLTIITQGGGEMLYARKGEEIHRMKPGAVLDLFIYRRRYDE